MPASANLHRMKRFFRARRARARLAGFTLLELLVVLLVAGIAAGVVGVAGQSYLERSRYHQTVRDITSQLRQARALSVQEGRPIAVTYQSEIRRLVVEGGGHLNIPPSLGVQWDVAERNAKTPTGAGMPIFVFNADGGARGGRLAVLRGGQGVVFRVNWLLGTIEQTLAAS